MSDAIAFSVMGEPFAKGRPRTTARIIYRDGRPVPVVTVFTPAKTRAGEKRITTIARKVMAARSPLDVALTLKVRCIFGIPPSWPKWLQAEARAGNVLMTARPDFDNLAKVIDALNGTVWRDDAVIIDATISKRCGPVPRMEIIAMPVNMDGRYMWPSTTREPVRRPAPPEAATADLFGRALGAT